MILHTNEVYQNCSSCKSWLEVLCSIVGLGSPTLIGVVLVLDFDCCCWVAEEGSKIANIDCIPFSELDAEGWVMSFLWIHSPADAIPWTALDKATNDFIHSARERLSCLPHSWNNQPTKSDRSLCCLRLGLDLLRISDLDWIILVRFWITEVIFSPVPAIIIMIESNGI